MKPKTIILLGVAMLAILGILAAVVIAGDVFTEQTYETRIRNAEKYLSEGDIDQAILEYEAAIEMDQTNPEAYLGLAALYRSRNLDALAKLTLEQGLNLTSDQQLRESLAQFVPEYTPQTTSQEPIVQDKTPNDVEPVLNVELLQFLSGATFKDYQNKYSDLSVSMAGDRCVVSSRLLPVRILFFDTSTQRVINPSTQQPYPECVPNEIHFDDICTLFGGVQQISYQKLQSLRGIQFLRQDGEELEFEAFGCRFRVNCGTDGTITAGAENRLVPTGTVSVIEHAISGNVVDATSGLPVSEAKLATRRIGSGSEIEAVTDSDGAYKLVVPEGGEYEITISKEGYIEETFSVYIPDGTQELNANFTIAPTISDDVIRIVLTWGASPTDLDSYLIGTASDGTSVHISFMNMEETNSSGELIAQLDCDDTTSYGPETITIYDTAGDYEFCVVDFTGSVGVGHSDAEVKIYKGNSLIQTITPNSDIGLGWKAFRIKDGEITVLNTEQPTHNGSPK